MFGFKLFGLGGSAVLGMIALIGVAAFKFSYDSGVRAQEIVRIRDRQEKLNAVILADIEDDRVAVAHIYGSYQADVAVILAAPLTPPQELPTCPADCSFF